MPKQSARNCGYGGIAQLARATGSYPVGRGFKSNFRYQWPVGQEVKTRPFHGCNSSSNLLRVTKNPVRKRRIFSYSLFTIHYSLFTFAFSRTGFSECKR